MRKDESRIHGIKNLNTRHKGYAPVNFASTLQGQVNRKLYVESKLPNQARAEWIGGPYGYLFSFSLFGGGCNLASRAAAVGLLSKEAIE